jgi:NNP family nitrate/nitrite transporter-like MFS transporter
MSYRITDWDPEDVVAWEAGNKNIARRNLIWSVAAEHIGFSVWSIWSVMVLFMPEAVYGFSAGDKFLLGATATLIGACLRIPYTLATATFGGRNWTVFSAFVLLIPTVGTMWLLAHPGLPLWPYLVCAALSGPTSTRSTRSGSRAGRCAIRWPPSFARRRKRSQNLGVSGTFASARA